MSFLDRIDENLIKNKPDLVGLDEVLCRCKKTIDLTHGKIQDMSDLCVELDIRSVNIFYGKTGTGKTTLSYCLAKYALQKYRIDVYALKIQDMIVADLGKTLENFHKAYEEIKEILSQGKGMLLFLDEFDRFLVDREQINESSEMKRAFISMMDFVESISFDQKISILATTNRFELLDPALKRRFSFQYEIECCEQALRLYSETLSKKIPQNFKYKIPSEYINDSKTIAELKQKVRDDILNFYKGDCES